MKGKEAIHLICIDFFCMENNLFYVNTVLLNYSIKKFYILILIQILLPSYSKILSFVSIEKLMASNIRLIYDVAYK